MWCEGRSAFVGGAGRSGAPTGSEEMTNGEGAASGPHHIKLEIYIFGVVSSQ